VVNLEFISANPTGPLHIGHTRWAALGDAMRRLLARPGPRSRLSTTSTMPARRWTSSAPRCWPAPKGQEPPEDGYPGAYVADRAAEVLAQRPDLLELPEAEAAVLARDLGYPLQLAAIQAPSTGSGCTSTCGSPSAPCTTGARSSRPSPACASRATSSTTTARSGCAPPTSATTRTVSSSGPTAHPTYFAADAAYYLSKKDRGFDEKIYLLGADHHGYINRLKAIAACAGDDPEHNIEVKIGQLVSIAGERMGKRLGNAIYMDELLEWIGSRRRPLLAGALPGDSPLSLDGEELRKQTNDNPVFYVQYAHARTGERRPVGRRGRRAP
jgi:arginyl-tRNA synthetase